MFGVFEVGPMGQGNQVMNNETKTYQGTVVRFMQTYGFLFSKEVGRRVFFHVSAFNSETDPVVGEVVEFELSPSNVPGKPDAATNINPVDGGAR
jgi:cold shock CspA family protein